MKNRVAWGLVGVLALVVLAGCGLLFVRLRPYWVAKKHREGASLQGAALVGAPLRGASLQHAALRNADLRNADLQDAFLGGALLAGADLRGANMNGVFFAPVFSDVQNLTLKVPQLEADRAQYDVRTRWPASFDPQQSGAVLTE